MAAAYKGSKVAAMSDSGTLRPNVVRSSQLYAAPRLRDLRRRAVLSQDELAARSRVGRSAIIHLEAGGVARAGTIRKLAEALGVEPAELMRQPPET